ncbi:MBL fold metallo-hydrolase [Vibrio panuliri]|uniref:MBL fold metallo-hydrolase n=1 Tax=Vibrio panuliri TaxID=1381081 RepID=A0ABX3FAQ9_9VIBR|nr:MBL fold metallo-hydrolase [Vibrio panuliri]OLQ85724.1 MBL fold metallo-hydrolase [Vibrio panuliri]
MSKLGSLGMITQSHIASVVGKFRASWVDASRRESEQRRLARIEQSPQFHQSKVINRLPRVASNESMSSVMKKFFFERSTLKPQNALPYQPVDIELLYSKPLSPRVTWLGHSSLYVEIDSVKLLIDPVFEYASPWAVKRMFARNVSSPITREKLPTPDAIVISHDHYDHLEKSTVRFYADKGVQFIVPLAVGRHLEKWGVAPDKIEELDWWESTLIGSVELTATPANHNSGRTGFDSNSTLWASWVIKGVSGSLFYSGDTAYDNHFKQIGERFGPFDIAFIEVAANVKNGIGYPVENWGHMQARHTANAYQDLQANILMPVHWSTFELFAHRWDEPIEDLRQEAQQIGAELITPMIGESFEIHSEINSTRWWESPEYHLTKVDYSYSG